MWIVEDIFSSLTSVKFRLFPVIVVTRKCDYQLEVTGNFDCSLFKQSFINGYRVILVVIKKTIYTTENR